MRTVVIRGNHDYRQDQPDEPDLIKPFFDDMPENLDYLDETGLFQVGNIEFGTVAVQDTLIRGAAGGIVGQLPDFPIPSEVEEHDTNSEAEPISHRVALFHGSVGGAKLQNGTEVDERHNYPLSWINGYDLILLGDIHVQQIHRAKLQPGNEFTCRDQKDVYITGKYNLAYESVPWGYAGSLVQQNFGEALWGHGYVLWDLAANTATTYHVRNTTGLVIVGLNADDVPCIKIRTGRQIQLMPLTSAVACGWFPTSISLRYTMNARAHIQTIQSMFESAGIVVNDTGFVEENNVTDESTAQVTASPSTTLANDLSDLNSTDTWTKYFTDTAKIADPDAANWVKHPHMLTTPNEVLPEPIASKINERNSKLQKSVDAYLQRRDVKSPVRLFRIHYMEFSWLLCYGADNWLNFDDFTKQVSLINGNNGSGKSALLEIVPIALYGESFPSRSSKSHSSAIINLNKKSHEAAYTRICFSINGKKYWLNRTFEQAPANPKNLWQRTIRLIDADTCEIIRQNANCVDPWIDAQVGLYEHFLLTTMMSQGNDSEFFSMPLKTQRSIIDSLLHLNVCEDFRAILKEALLDHNYALNQLQAYEAGQQSSSNLASAIQLPQTEIDALTLKRTTLAQTVADLHTEKQMAKVGFSAVAERVFQSPLADYTSEAKRLQSVTPLSTDIPSLKSQKQQLRDRLAVLKTKAPKQNAATSSSVTPTAKPPKESFDIIDATLSDLRMQRQLKAPTSRLYDSSAHKAWQEKQTAWLQANPNVPPSDSALRDLEKSARAYKEELDSYEEFDESEHTAVGPKALKALEKQDAQLETTLDSLDADIKAQKTELAKHKATLTAGVRNQLETYNKALVALNTHFGSSSEAATIINSITTSNNKLDLLKQSYSSTKRQLDEIASTEFNPKCTACQKNPVRTKQTELTAQLTTLQTSMDALNKSIASQLPKGLTLAEANILYNAWQILHSANNNKIVAHLHAQTQEVALTTSLAALNIQYANLEMEREELGYTNQLNINNYYMYKANYTTVQLQIQAIKFQNEAADWALAESVSSLDAQIAALTQTHAAAYSHAYSSTEQALKETEDLLAQHEAYVQASKRLEELALIQAAYPHWLNYTELDNQHRPLHKELLSVEARLKQALDLQQHFDAAQTKAEQIATYRNLLSVRAVTIKSMAEAFEQYTDWLYPNKVKPAIETAVNAVLSSIALPRPISLVAEWDAGHFNWYVQDGTSRPPYEKSSGAQRFFVSLALRLAFSRMGTSNMINAQIFLDEGFTACDAETMERVPTLLKSLLNKMDYLQTVFLVSHLDTLKSAASRSITISRGAQASFVRIGDRVHVPKPQLNKATVVKGSIVGGDHHEIGEVIDAIDVPTKGKARVGRPKKQANADKEIVVS
jgi:DNA repair exonuclease SbcCD ATPase subunit